MDICKLFYFWVQSSFHVVTYEHFPIGRRVQMLVLSWWPSPPFTLALAARWRPRGGGGRARWGDEGLWWGHSAGQDALPKQTRVSEGFPCQLFPYGPELFGSSIPLHLTKCEELHFFLPRHLWEGHSIVSWHPRWWCIGHVTGSRILAVSQGHMWQGQPGRVWIELCSSAISDRRRAGGQAEAEVRG